jgi:hypothetical protein
VIPPGGFGGTPATNRGNARVTRMGVNHCNGVQRRIVWNVQIGRKNTGVLQVSATHNKVALTYPIGLSRR